MIECAPTVTKYLSSLLTLDNTCPLTQEKRPIFVISVTEDSQDAVVYTSTKEKVANKAAKIGPFSFDVVLNSLS